MAYLIRAFFAFWFGTLLTYCFAGVPKNRKNIIKVWIFFVIALALQGVSNQIGDAQLAERLYPFTTHLPLMLWLVFLHKVKWEVSIGAVLTAYLCCELPNWFSKLVAIPFGSNYTVEVIAYCVSSIVILILLARLIAPSLQGLFKKNKKMCFAFSAIPFLYYLWCYSATVYTTYLMENGYQVALTMSALFALLFLIFSIVQYKRQEDEEIMVELRNAKNAEQEAKQEAIRANKAKGDFLASMSHEIRTPINAVLGIDEMILRECNDPVILDYAKKIKTSGQSLLYLINDILDLSKIESERMDITPTEYEPVKLISEVLLMIEPRAEAKGLNLQYKIDSNTPSKLFGDDMRIRQILINLLTNAVKYTDEGKVTLVVQVAKKEDKKATIHFSVRDTGIGIKEEDRESLFESFRRVDLAHNKKIEGTGLGLSITLKLLHLMDSDLQLQSAYGVGSNFFFEIAQDVIDNEPIGEFKKGFQQVDITDTYRESFVAPNAKVLVVDDNDMNLIVFKGLLKNSQMNIKTARSGQEALDFINSERFDIVFMDHLMPKMDGVEALQHILDDNSLRKNANVVIALTANAISGAKESYLKAGFSGYLKKPISGQELEKTILEFLPSDMIQSINQDVEKHQSTESTPPQTEEMSGEVLNQDVGMSYCAGDKGFYFEVLKVFVDSNFTAILNDLIEKQDWKNYEISIHGIKSGAKSIGAIPLSDLAKASEMALKERNDTEFVVAQHPQVLTQIKEVENIIYNLLNKQ